MKPTVVVSLVLLILSGAAVFVTEAGRAQRSARWDAFLSESRHKRSTSSWEDGDTCTMTGLTADDTLGRRVSGLLSPPQNQGWCGSCWAFGAAHTYTDHRSIAAGSLTDQLSPQYLTACITNNREPTQETQQPIDGCCGDSIGNAVRYLQMVGAVTESCAPYNLFGYWYKEPAHKEEQTYTQSSQPD